MNILQIMGWDDQRKSDFASSGLSSSEPGRIAAADRGKYVVLAEKGPVIAECSGKFLHNAKSMLDMPAVGDWVAFRLEESSAIIEKILPRDSCLMRKMSSQVYEAQVICVNLDKLFIVTTVGRDLNCRRIQRYLAASFAAGANPLVVVNKRDIPHRWEDIMDELKEISHATEIITTSTIEENGLSEMTSHILPGETIALVGSSGVGKSSIINRLIDQERQETAEVRPSDLKGRHRTARRELIVAPGDFMVIDTPGMREFGLWDVGEGLDELFSEIAALSTLCQFRDCSHGIEPGCAVVKAVEEGLLPRTRLESYVKLKAEQSYTAEKALQRDGKQTKRRKQIAKDKRKRMKTHKKLGLKDN